MLFIFAKSKKSKNLKTLVMKKNLKLIPCLLLLLAMIGCTETESVFEEVPKLTSVNLTASSTKILVGGQVTFSSTSNLSSNVTQQSIFYVNDVAITSSTYTFTGAGIYSIKAVHQNLTSNIIQITVEAPVVVVNKFANRVLVEEYSGTWCGNCPRILYGTELLKKQTTNAVSVQIHLYNGDPFITASGNALASELGIGVVPTGNINRTIGWNGPQYQNVSQVINEIKTSSQVGLAINSTLNTSNLNINVVLGYANTALQTNLIVYIVEDNLFHTQANYSSNLYGGLSSIPNFEYDGVLRAVITPATGETISATGTQVNKNFTVSLPSNVKNSSNAKIVAFLIDATTKTVLNVRQAAIGETQVLETL